MNEIRRERRVELALEGHRLNDLLRWKAHHLIKAKQPKGFKYVGSDLVGKIVSDDTGADLVEVGKVIFLDENGYISPYEKSLPSGYEFNEGRDYLYPLPIEDLTLNENLKQNPGW